MKKRTNIAVAVALALVYVSTASADWGEYGPYVAVSRPSVNQLIKFDKNLDILEVVSAYEQDYMAPSIDGGGGLLTHDAQGLLVVWDEGLNVLHTAAVSDPLEANVSLDAITRTTGNSLAIMRTSPTWKQLSTWSGTDLSVDGAESTTPNDHSLLTADSDGGFFTWGSTQQGLFKWNGTVDVPVVAFQDMGAYTVTDLVRLDGGQAAVYRGSGLDQLSVWNGSDLSLVAATSAYEPEFMTPTEDGGFIAWHPGQDLLVKWSSSLAAENTASMGGRTVDGICRLSTGDIVVSRGGAIDDGGTQLSLWDEDLNLQATLLAYGQQYMTPVDDGGFISYDSTLDLLVKFRGDLTVENTFDMEGQVPTAIGPMLASVPPETEGGDSAPEPATLGLLGLGLLALLRRKERIYMGR